MILSRYPIAICTAIILYISSESSAYAETDSLAVVIAKPISQVVKTSYNHVPAKVIGLSPTQKITAKTTGEIKEIKAKAGDNVTKNQEVATIDCFDNKMQWKNAKSRLKISKETYKTTKNKYQRLSKLTKSQHISAEQIESSLTNLTIAKAELSISESSALIAKRQVENCSIVANENGTITEVHVAKGFFVNIGSPIADIVNPSKIEVAANFPTSAVLRDELNLKNGNNDNSYAFIFNDKSYEVVPRTNIPLTNAQTQTQEIRFQFTGDATNLNKGLYGTLQWADANSIIPDNYIVKINGESGFFTIKTSEDGVLTANFVPLEHSSNGKWHAKVFVPDVLMIVEGHLNLKNNDPVIIQSKVDK